MTTIALMSRYLLWHYTQGIADTARLLRTLFWFIARTFSLTTLLRTFFKPWKEEKETYPSIVNPGEFFEALGVNVIMRVVGMIARTTLIIACLVLLALAIPFSIAIFILWLLLPFIVPALAILGIALIFS